MFRFIGQVNSCGHSSSRILALPLGMWPWVILWLHLWQWALGTSVGGGRWDGLGVIGAVFMDPELLPLPMHMLYHLCGSGGAELTPGVTHVAGLWTHWKGPLFRDWFEAGHMAQARWAAQPHLSMTTMTVQGWASPTTAQLVATAGMVASSSFPPPLTPPLFKTSSKSGLCMCFLCRLTHRCIREMSFPSAGRNSTGC